MKRVKLIMFVLAGAMALCLVACSSMESDAKKLAKMQYKLEFVGSRVGTKSYTKLTLR
jgi:predicted component of type VI protein secretion system